MVGRIEDMGGDDGDPVTIHEQVRVGDVAPAGQAHDLHGLGPGPPRVARPLHPDRPDVVRVDAVDELAVPGAERGNLDAAGKAGLQFRDAQEGLISHGAPRQHQDRGACRNPGTHGTTSVAGRSFAARRSLSGCGRPSGEGHKVQCPRGLNRTSRWPLVRRRTGMPRATRRVCAVALFAPLCLIGQVLSQPPAELTRYWGNLDGEWRFAIDPDEAGEKAGWMQAGFDDSAWRTLKAPGYWEAQGVTDTRPGQPPKPKDGMPYTDYDGVAWYRKHIIVPREWAGQELVLHLGSVDDFDRTYVNGELVGETPLDVPQAVSLVREYRIAPARVRFGEENVLALQVRDGGGPGGLMGPLLTLLPVSIAEEQTMLPQDDRPFPERFADPPASCRILKIVHSLPDKPHDQDMLFRSLISQGFGGVVCNVSFTDYLTSAEKWAALVRGVTEAKKLGMALWVYDEKGYPSGTAGGLTMQGHPEWEARGLLIAEADSKGGAVTLDLPPGQLVSAAAYPVKDGVIDTSAAVDLAGSVRDGKLTWEALQGQWRVMAITEDFLYEGTHASMSLADKLHYINLLDPAPTKRFTELTYGGYAKHLGNDLGKYFIASFTDEPSLMSYFMRRMPYKVLPWSPNLAEEFQRRRGRALAPLIPALITDAGPDTAKARHDFWLTVGEL
ncbi:MAG: hypothetical protein FJX75_29685, partial [Armatimonadetes bacterium]|nr:hypothetical protein [Armatimonadota bacterium]